MKNRIIGMSAVALVLVLGGARAESVVAELIGASGLPRITLLDSHCVGAARSFVDAVAPQHYRGMFRKLRAVFQLRNGSVQSYTGCWLRLDPPEASEAIYVMLFDDGDHLAVPLREFRDHRRPAT